MKSAENNIDNSELFDWITDCKWPCLSAVVLNGLSHQIFMNDEFYSSVARQSATDSFFYPIEQHWRDALKDEDSTKDFAARVNKCANDLWEIENHMRVGRQLGFDKLTQGVYDAFDTYIDSTYRYRQVDFAREFAAWISENWTIG